MSSCMLVGRMIMTYCSLARSPVPQLLVGSSQIVRLNHVWHKIPYASCNIFPRIHSLQRNLALLQSCIFRIEPSHSEWKLSKPLATSAMDYASTQVIVRPCLPSIPKEMPNFTRVLLGVHDQNLQCCLWPGRPAS